jgi:hypothetical protein
MTRYILLLLSVFFLTSGIEGEKKAKPVIYLIGDSTVKNGSGRGDGGLWGWGDYLYTKIDTLNISIRNYAIGGRSSRSFISEGRWNIVLARLRPGDYAKWAAEAASTEKAFYINLNERIAQKYESIGEDVVKTKYFGADHTHTLKEGAILNASVVEEGIKSLKGCKLKKYI